MPDAIATINGKAAMAYSKVSEADIPWHKLGTALDGPQVGSVMQVAAQLNWEVLMRDLYAQDQHGIMRLIDGWKATVRSTDNVQLGVVHSTYKPIQNSEVFDFADALLATGEVKFETAGALYEGRVVWALAKVEDALITIDGDPSPIEPYLLISTGHDALRAFRVDVQPVRVVCANTLNIAVKGSKRSYTIRHTKNSQARVQEARSALRVNVDYLKQFEKVAAELMARPLTVRDFRRFTEVLLPSGAQDLSKVTKISRQQDSMVSLFERSETLEGVKNNAYRALQAVGEWADHERGFRDTKRGNAEDARALAILDGTAVNLKDRALGLLLSPQATGMVPFRRFPAKATV